MSGGDRGPKAPAAEGRGAQAGGSARRPRADALRNRERLLEAAKAAIAQSGPDVSLDDIARRAGVGIGTLYRHFPTREALIEAVYRHGVEQLAGAAASLLHSHPPGAALRQWMRLFIDYIVAKKLIAPALGAILDPSSELYASSVAKIAGAMGLLVESARASGDIRADVDPMDLLRALVGFTYANVGPDWRASALRLIDILMDGLRAPPAAG